jgi:hypothetical protein
MIAAAVAAALVMPAFAQQPLSQKKNDRAGFVQSQHATDWRGSKLIGATVYGPDNASIGDIDDVLIANDGKIRAVVIAVGTFVSTGDKAVAVPFEALNITRRPASNSVDKITVSYSKDDLKNAPKFAYDDIIDSIRPGLGTMGMPPTDNGASPTK